MEKELRLAITAIMLLLMLLFLLGMAAPPPAEIIKLVYQKGG